MKTKLNVGDIIKYEPSHNSYSFNYSLINNNDKNVTLSNRSLGLRISKWRIFKIDGNKVLLVPYKIPFRLFFFSGFRGYNNGVKFLNNICEKLYSDENKKVSARSINMDDIESILNEYNDEEVLNNIKNRMEYFGSQDTDKGYDHEYSWYPEIYKDELNSVVDGVLNKKGLGRSEYNDKTYNYKVLAKRSIRPFISFYNTVDYKTTYKLFNIYSKLLLPHGKLTNYWIASRCIGRGKCNGHFDLRRIRFGLLRAGRMYDSKDKDTGFKSCLFPVISVDITSIKKDKYLYI